ncbi:MAG: dimethylsulfoniopropionate lyase, partial [Gammaproteobacteria bacterium]|nr:dimethylsulfoniopropionate lyase [Gammaproteobacteria bacterium]
MATSLFDLTDRTLTALVAGLEKRHAGEDGVAETLARLNAQDYTQRGKPKAPAKRDPACRHLAAGIAATWHVDKNLSAAIGDLAPLLHWQRVPEQVPRPPQGFMDDYAYTQIIGPSGVYPGDDFMFGLFIIGPRQIYPEHSHASPELYWLFTGPTAWRLPVDGPWTQKRAGELQWIKPQQVHAIRTLDVPLLATWTWTEDIDGDFCILGADRSTP